MAQFTDVVGTYRIVLEVDIEKSASKDIVKLIEQRQFTIQGVNAVRLTESSYTPNKDRNER